MISTPSFTFRKSCQNWPAAYFRSGWAFLLPYQLLYLVYAWQQWPANPDAPASATTANGIFGSLPLLHLFWGLHGVHGVLGLWILGHCWMRNAEQPRRTGAMRWAVLRWVLLGLVFLIPGVFLEYPADPWEHLRRINAWSTTNEIREYSHWAKSGYFFAYSLIGGFASHPWQLFLCRLYFTGMSLLLCWQYYALARALNLPTRPAFLFVILQAILLGNDTFSFYRYYGLSSTIVAQIAAIALVRHAVVFAGSARSGAKTAVGLKFGPPRPGHLAVWLGLLIMMAFNHLQALGIATLGVMAVFIRTAVNRHRPLLWCTVATVLLASIGTALWWPATPAMEQAVRDGWLNQWRGFNLLSLQSPAAARAWAIFGVLGTLNLLAGMVLAMRNQLAGWLTILPFVALCLPVIAIPFADLITRAGADNIVAFHRLLLGIPAGLALIVAGRRGIALLAARHERLRPNLAFGALAIGLGLLTVTPSHGPWMNRFWNLLVKVPADLEMRPVWDGLQTSLPPLSGQAALYASSSRISFVLETLAPVPTVYAPYYYRGFVNGGGLPGTDAGYIDRVLINVSSRAGSVVVVPDPRLLFTPYSQTAYSSRHWLAQEAALAFAGSHELEVRTTTAGLTAHRRGRGISYYLTRPDP